MLRTRITSALIIAPPILVAGWFGAWPFALFVVLCGVLMVWEWMQLCRARFGLSGVIMAASLGASSLAAYLAPSLSLVPLIVAAPLVRVTAARAAINPWWVTVGLFYMGPPLVAIVLIRVEGGWETLFWLFAIVWATDVGAYAFGRSIGGPKIAPKVSPSKTWAGLIGGMLCAGGISGLFVYGLETQLGGGAILIAAGLAVVSQAGDFLESAIKRRFDVKDSGKIIPGHGGVLDRVDGLMAAACVVALVVISRQGGIATW